MDEYASALGGISFYDGMVVVEKTSYAMFRMVRMFEMHSGMYAEC